MSINSMYPDGWFALGAAALKVNCVISSMPIIDLLLQLNLNFNRQCRAGLQHSSLQLLSKYKFYLLAVTIHWANSAKLHR